MPTLEKWQRQYGSDSFQVIGVSMDGAPADVISTIVGLKLIYPVLMGDEHLGTATEGFWDCQ
jgi:hypothetical protein